MDYLRTLDARFEGLQDYDFTPHYLMVDDTQGGTLRVHHLDEGPGDAAPVLLMHGEPSWCYLYRHMIGRFTAHGHRVIAPDLVGFGRSDKPTERADYTYQRHVDWIGSVLRQLDLRGITLVCQDWGGLIGLRLWADMPDRFARIVVAIRRCRPAIRRWERRSRHGAISARRCRFSPPARSSLAAPSTS